MVGFFLSACGGADDPPAVGSDPGRGGTTTGGTTTGGTTTGGTTTGGTTTEVVGTGLPCSTLNATSSSSGERFDCVQVGNAQQWHPRGSQLNPLGRNESVVVTTQLASWRIAVTGFDADMTAEILAEDARNPAPASGSQYAGLRLELTWLGGSGINFVRNGANFYGVTPSKDSIERWAAGAGVDDDCWINEAVELNTTKICRMPYEVSSAEVGSIDFYVAAESQKPLKYFRGADR